ASARANVRTNARANARANSGGLPAERPDAVARRDASRPAQRPRPRLPVAPHEGRSQLVPLRHRARREAGLDVPRSAGYAPAHRSRLVSAGLAHSAKNTVGSLETPQLQRDTLTEDPETPIAALVESGLDELESGRARPLLNKLVRLWAESDEAELGRYERWC